MNKNLHRIIFNAKRGQRMVVAETASAHGKAASGNTAGMAASPGQQASLHSLHPLRFAVLAALGLVLWLQPAAFTPVHAQIIAAPGAPAGQRPTVLQTANGLPQVNIQTPSAAGVSRNTYSQFDVNQPGAILNNSRSNVQTQLGGFVGANPWLATGPARVVLNEVQSANPSQIRGYVEVAGQRAEVIIANPAGINVNGGGFLNASRVTLTTGSPVMNDGALDGFRVQGGNITVGGAGLDTSTADYTGILARAVQVNAGIWAKELRVVTGANEINADHTSATPITGTGAAPTYAIDVAQLGGMYAGKIYLIGTETGLGVRNAGVIAATGGDLVLQSNGWLTNSGSLQAAGNVQASTQGTITNSGTVYANGNTTLAAQGGIANSNGGVVAAQGNTSLQATGASITSAAGSVIAAGMAADGTLTSGGNLSASAAGALSLNGQTVSGGNASLSGTQVNLADGKLSGQNITVFASAGNIDASRATVNAQGALSANAAQTLRTDGAAVAANQLSLAAQDISNAAGEIVQTGTGNTTIALTSPTGTLNNSAGRIAASSQSLTFSAATLNNTGGKIEHAGSGTLAVNASTFSGDGGIIASTGTTSLVANTMSHNNATLSAAGVSITAGTLSNRGGTISQSGLGAASVTATGAFDNSGGKVLSNGNTTVSAQSLNNQGGVVQATGASSLAVTTTGALDNSASGQIAAGGTATLSSGSLNNTLGKVTAGAGLNASATGAITNVQGLLASNGAATLSAASVDNTRGVIASVQNNANVTTTGATANDSGRIEAAGDITLANAGLSNTQAAGQTTAGSITGRAIAINTSGQALNNAFGTIAAAQGATLQTGALNNNAGLIQAGAALGINTGGQALTNTHAAGYASGAGGITSQGVMTLTTGNLNNAGGFIGAKAALNATTAAVSNTAAGQIVGESSVSFTSSSFDNQGGQVQALGDAGINAGAGAINNTGGLLRSAATATLSAASVINSNTLGANQGIEGNNIAITAGAISNNSGAIRTTTNATLTSGGTLNNTAGLVSAGNTATVQDSNPNSLANPAARTLAITNTGGTLVAGRSLAASAASLSGAGSLQSQQDLSLSLAGDFSNTGTISATGNNTVSVGGTLTNSGKLQAGATLDVTAATIDNTATGEMTGTTTKITATAANTLINRGLIDGVDTQINAITLNNLGTGRIYGTTLSIAATTINNDAETVGGVTTAATIAARQRLDIGATTLNNSNGALIFSAGDMAIGGSLDGARRATGQATLIKNASATIESLGAMALTAASIQNTNPSFSYTLTTTGPVSKMDMVASDGTVYASTDFAWTTTRRYSQFIAPTDIAFPVIGGQSPGSPYAALIYKTYFEGPNAFEAAYQTPPSGDANNGFYYPDVLNYQNTDPVWALFGMANPSNTTPGPRPVRTWVGSQDQGAFVDPTPAEIAAWEAASAPWQALQLKLDAFRAAAQSTLMLFPVRRDYTESDQTATVNAGKPAQILSGGNMSLNASGTLLNDNSRIIAGGVLSATAQAVNNQATQITAVQSRSGSATRFGITGEDCFLGDCSHVYGFIVDPYAQNIPHTITTGIAVSQSNAAVPGTGTVLAGLTPGSVSAAPGAIGTPSAAARSAGIVQVTSSVGAIGSLAANVPVVRTIAPNTGIPTTSLFRAHPGPASAFLIETDPRFANYRTWLGSDYMLGQLTLDPAVTQKRLGDGFYEQRLINEQIAQLTGQRFLGNYTSEEVQYKALMDAGITYAAQMNLRPGIALTAVQMAALTSDIVWLVEQTVTLPDGSTQRVLVPQVYVRVQAGDVDGAGTLLAGREINLNVNGDLTNTGTVAGRQVMALTAENIHNLGGRISGNAVALTARSDLNNLGGQIDAANSLNVAAGRDLNIVSTTTALTTTGSTVGPTVSTFSGIDRVAGLYITNPGGTLLASAGRDMNLVAGVIQSQGSAQLQAGNNLNLATVTQTDSVDATRDERNYTRFSQSKDVGSQISATGNVSLVAGKDINATAASITSEQGALVASAGNNVNIKEGRKETSLATATFVEDSDAFSSASTEVRRSASASTAAGSSLSGNTITVVAGKDINVKGSSVVSDAGTTLVAGNNLSIEAATNTSSSTSFEEKKQSGLLDDGGGISIGTQEQSTDRKTQGTSAAASTVGSIAGNVTLQAGEAYKQVGSDVIAPAGDITILAKTVDIVEARETSRYESEDKFKQSALTVSVSSPLLSALETGQQMADAASNTSDGRMQALAGAAAAFKGYNTYKGLTDAAGNFSEKNATDITINLSYGSSESESKSSRQSNSAAGSTVAAGNNLTIVATGAGQESNLTTRGATLTAGNNVTLLADNQVNLLASQSTASQESSNSSSSSSVGISYGVVSQSFGFSASANSSQGNSSGSDTTYTNTQVTAGNTASIISGGDTNLIGAVVAANTVKADVGGNLNIASLQDSSTYTSKQSSAGASVSFGKGSVTGGGVSASNSNIDSSYASVVQQSGIKAGDGGFQVDVQGNTDLKGSVIASTQAAVEQGKNSFTTGGSLTLSDIQNSAEYKGSGYSISLSMGSGLDAKGNTIYSPGGEAGIGSADGNASSTSSSGISGVAGNTAVRTGDAETGIEKIFDAERVRKEIDAQVAITAAFGQEASSAWGKYANQKMVDATDEEERACWSANGNCRIAGHSVIGALGGGIGGALGAAGSTALAPYLSKAIDDLGITGPARDALIAGLSSTIGGVVGGTAGAAGAFNEVTNNYLTSKQWQELADKLGTCAKQSNGCSSTEETKIRQEFQAISNKQDVELKTACVDLSSVNCRSLLASANAGTAKQLELGQQYAKTQVGLPAYYLSGSDFNATISLLQRKVDAYDMVAACAKNQAQCDAQRLNGSIRLALTGVSVAAMTAFAVELGVVGLAVVGDGSGMYCATKPQQCLNLLNGIAEMIGGVPTSGYNPLTVNARGFSGYGKTTYTGPNGEVIQVGNVIPGGFYGTKLPSNSGAATVESSQMAVGVASNLDWTRISARTGGDAAEHVAINHGALSLTKPNQGVFYGNPVSTLEDAWLLAQQNSLKPVTVGNRDIYVVPRPNSGYAGGMGGQLENYNHVTIITEAGTNRVVTGYPSGGTPPLPKGYEFLLETK